MQVGSFMQKPGRFHLLEDLKQDQSLEYPELSWRMKIIVHEDMPPDVPGDECGKVMCVVFDIFSHAGRNMSCSDHDHS